jgi:nucleoside 2-deoxyribosyltransferase
MKVYLACTVRGDRAAVAALREVATLLERDGHTVLTRHLLADDVENAEGMLTERDVFDRDMQWLASADLVVADASGSSYGVGFEVGYTLGRAGRSRQRVLLLYDAARREKISRLVLGNAHPACTTCPYENVDDLVRIVQSFVVPVPDC